MVENFDYVDPDRVGVMGWSHGGLHALMNIFDHPDDYQCAFAGVPVSDLIFFTRNRFTSSYKCSRSRLLSGYYLLRE